MKITRFLVSALAAVTLLASCSKEELAGNSLPEATTGSLSVQLPGMLTPQRTYAYDNGVQNELERSVIEMWVYLFDETTGDLVYSVGNELGALGNSIAHFPLKPGVGNAMGLTEIGGVAPTDMVTAIFVSGEKITTATGENINTFKNKVVDFAVTSATNLNPVFVMMGEVATAFAIEDYNTTTTFTAVQMTRLAARIDITNKLGDAIVIKSAQILNGAQTSTVGLPGYNAGGTIADYPSVNNVGYNIVNGILGDGTGDDMQRMWSHLYTYPNDNANPATATTVELIYELHGTEKTVEVEFKKEDGTPMPIERNHRYEIVISQDAMGLPIVIVEVSDLWDNHIIADGDITMPITITLPANATYVADPSGEPSKGGTFGVDGDGVTLEFKYASTSEDVSFLMKGNADAMGTWVVGTIAKDPLVYAAASPIGAYTGTVSVVFDENELTTRTAQLVILSGDQSVTYTFNQAQTAGAPPAATIDSDANTFMIKPSSEEFVFDMAQVIREGKNRLPNITDRIGVRLEWTDNPNGVSANGVVSVLKAYNAGHKTFIKVVPGTAEGVAVISAFNYTTGKVAWSWTVWSTNDAVKVGNNWVLDDSKHYTYTATGTASATHPGNGKTRKFMDRNLGALNATPGDLGSFGLMYQWGRKDAFWSAGVWSNTERTMYNATGGAVTLKKYDVVANAEVPTANGADNNLDYAVENPLVYLWSSVDHAAAEGGVNRDWYTVGYDRSKQNNTLWAVTESGFNVTKQVYDPCPKGYRVHENGALNGLVRTATAYAFPWSAELRGRVGLYNTPGVSDWSDPAQAPGASATVGYYPASGYRHSASGSFSAIGTNGYNWSSTVLASASSGRAYSLNLTATTLSTSNNSNRASGFPVRCVQE